MGILERINALNADWSLSRIFIPLFLFFQPFNRVATIKEVLFIAILLLLAARLLKGNAFDFKERTFLALTALFAVALLSSVLSPYAADSLNTIRKNLFYEATIYLAIVAEYRSFDDLRPVFLSMITSFFALSLLIVLFNGGAVLMNWLAYPNAPFMGGYSTFAAFYMPLSAGYLIFSGENGKTKILMSLFIALGLLLTILNNHRTQLAAVIISFFIIMLASKRWKALAIGLAAFALVAFALALAKPETLSRHETLLAPKSFVAKDTSGLNDRDSIWLGTWDMIQGRPVIGYGYGWKKTALVAKDFGYLEKWDKKSRTFLYFNEAAYGRANPHNLTLQILFEIGFLGFFAFIIFWFSVVSKCAAMFKKGAAGGRGALFLKFAVPGVLISYAILNLTNGYWHEAYGNLMLTLAAVSSVLYADAARNKP